MTASEARDDSEHLGSDAAPSVAVCICTYGRPVGLENLLGKLTGLEYAGNLHVVVADNHPEREGETVCRRVAPTYPYRLSSVVEPRTGISFARNAVIREALRQPVDFVAMIDDDEWPHPDWIDALLKTQAEADFDIVGGPTEPVFERSPPNWMVKCRLFHSMAGFGTGNILYRAEMLRECEGDIFDPRLARLGGEDVDFARRMMALGKRFAPCEGALTYERVPTDRMTLGYVFLRAFRIGNVLIIRERNEKPGWRREIVRPLFLLQKIVYAAEHLVFTVVQPWRFSRCVLDLIQVLGITVGLFNLVYVYYGADADRRWRFRWNPLRSASARRQ